MYNGRVHVLFLADAVFEDLPGGSRTVARETARELVALGHKVTFLVGRHLPNTPDTEERNGYRIVRYEGAGQGRRFNDEGEAAARKLLDSGEKFDIVHTHFAWSAVGPLKALTGIPHIRTFHGPWDEESWVEDVRDADQRQGAARMVAMAKAQARRILKKRIEAQNLKSALRVVVLSEYMKGQALRYGTVPPERIRIAPGGADLVRFTPGNRAEARARLDLPLDRKILFCVRRLAPRMGLDNLLVAMEQVKGTCPEALLLLGGKGPLAGTLQDEIGRRGLSDHVRLLGFVPDDRLADYYRAADLFVLPTVALEGFGLVTVEALASGTPVLATPTGATPEILGPLDSRLLTKDASPEALTEGILQALTGDWLPTLTPEKLRQFVEERYSWRRHTEACLALYEEVRHGHS